MSAEHKEKLLLPQSPPEKPINCLPASDGFTHLAPWRVYPSVPALWVTPTLFHIAIRNLSADLCHEALCEGVSLDEGGYAIRVTRDDSTPLLATREIKILPLACPNHLLSAVAGASVIFSPSVYSWGICGSTAPQGVILYIYPPVPYRTLNTIATKFLSLYLAPSLSPTCPPKPFKAKDGRRMTGSTPIFTY